MTVSQSEIIYLSVVAGIALVLMTRTLIWLRIAERRNQRRLQKARLAVVKTSSPVDHPVAEAKERGAENIAASFSIGRKIFVPSVIVLTALLACVPFLDDLPAGTLSLVAAVATVLFGLALRPILENVAAGLVIAFSRVVSVGDTLEMKEFYGYVEDISLTHTTIKLWDWRRYVIANSRILQEEFVNNSLTDTFVWANVDFYVDYSADLDEVQRLVTTAIAAAPQFQDHEPPRFWVIGLERDCIHCWAAGWTNNPAEAWRLKSVVRAQLAAELTARGWAPRKFRIDSGVSADL